MEQNFGEIKDNVNTEEIIRKLVPMQDRGKYMLGSCPFHNDDHPSFAFYPKDERWVCFSCGSRGDIFDFYSRYYDVSISEAARRLAATNPSYAPDRTVLASEREWLVSAVDLCNEWMRTWNAQMRKIALRKAAIPDRRKLYAAERDKQRAQEPILIKRIEEEARHLRRSRQVAKLASATSVLSKNNSPFIFGSRSFKDTCRKIATLY